MTKVDLSERAFRSISQVLSATATNRPVFLFGSRVTGLARPDSDLDILVGGETSLTREQRRNIADALEDLGLPFEIDVIDLHDAQGMFLKRVQSEWVPLSEAIPEPAEQVIA